MANGASNEVLGLSVLTAAEAAFAYSAFLPSLMTIGVFGNDKFAKSDLRQGEALATGFAIVLGLASSHVAKSRLPFIFSMVGAGIMIGIYEYKIATARGLGNMKAAQPSGPLLWGTDTPVRGSVSLGRFAGGADYAGWGAVVPGAV